MSYTRFSLPWPKKVGFQRSIYPIFIPFAGCKQRCIFCAQHLQSGKKICADSQDTQAILGTAAQDLALRKAQNKAPLEIAFYGGTFTALPEQDFDACLAFTLEQSSLGHSIGARCSTRPDAVSSKKLQALQEAGFTSIELGIQSFHTEALNAAQRHYTQATAFEACQRVREAQFSLGVQLMPGMPGVTPAIFLQDVDFALQCGAHFLRMYPCQVIAGTSLEQLWQEGGYIPWDLPQTIDSLSQGWLKAHLAHIPVIRMGLAPQNQLESHILAGPRHPALGNMVQSRALYLYIIHTLEKNAVFQVRHIQLPQSCQGYFWGHGQNLVSSWQKIGIHKNNISWKNSEYIEITV